MSLVNTLLLSKDGFEADDGEDSKEHEIVIPTLPRWPGLHRLYLFVLYLQYQ